jgi:hypothetical protein
MLKLLGMLRKPSRNGDESSRPAWEAALDARRSAVLAIPGVHGVGIGGKPGRERIVVHVQRDLKSSARKPIEEALQDVGAPVDIETGGLFRRG